MATLEIRDAIHKRIILTNREQILLNRPYVQRLRHVRQLGFVPLVYPSATHDRFSHSIGTAHIAGLLVKEVLANESSSVLARILKPAEKEFLTEILRLAGLLHDLGHAPFSHSAELMMPRVSALDLPAEWRAHPDDDRSATHEDYSVALLWRLAAERNPPLDRDEAAIIASLIHHKEIRIPPAWERHFSPRINAESLHALARSLISSNIDADRMDYLLRDSHFTGVPYGQFDLDWLISNLGTVELDDRYFLSIPESGIHALEHYLFARYHMYSQVYMHKTAKCFEYYFQKAIGEGEISYTIPAEPELFAALRDSTLWEALYRAAARSHRSWSALLTGRIPAKRIARVWDDQRAAEKIYKTLRQEFAKYRIRTFLHPSYKRFLDLPDGRTAAPRGRQGLILFGLAAVPIAVIRRHLGAVSAASLADSSFILKRYHRDLYIADYYVLREDYEASRNTIHKLMKKYRNLAAGEVLLAEEI